MYEAQIKKIQIVKQSRVNELHPEKSGFTLVFNESKKHFDKVIIASGGSPKAQGFEWLKNIGHAIINPIPSLFTFNMPEEPVKGLMGLVVENATARIQGTKLAYTGRILITHWGMSGPAILKLSAWNARLLYDYNYKFNVQMNWLSI